MNALKIGDIVKVQDEAYRVPPTASRASMEAMMFDDGKTNDPKIKAKIEKFKESASGKVKRKAYGVVKAIRDGLVAFKNLSTDQIEHAMPDHCDIIDAGDLPSKAMRAAVGH